MYNLKEIYVDNDDPWMGILEADYFIVGSTYHHNKFENPGQLIFGQGVTLPITHIANCRYIRQRKQVKIYKYVIRKNST